MPDHPNTPGLPAATVKKDETPLQTAFLKKQQVQRTPIAVIATDGAEYLGVIGGFDRFSVLLVDRQGDVVIKHLFFKHAIRAIRKVKTVEGVPGSSGEAE
jgi:RNA chaperone Hfq